MMNQDFMARLMQALQAGGQGIPRNPMYNGQQQMPPQAMGGGMPPMALPQQANPMAQQNAFGAARPPMPQSAQGVPQSAQAMQNANPMARFRR